MAFSAKIACNDTSAQALGTSGADRAIVTNRGPGVVWIYSNNPPFSDGLSDAEKAAVVVALGTPIAVDEKFPINGPSGVDLTTYFVSCDTDAAADVRAFA